MANPLYGSNKNDEALDAIAKAIDGGVATSANAAGTHSITITIGGTDYEVLLVEA
jgi:hypothetical protein